LEHFYGPIEGWMGYEDTYQEAVRITPDGGTIVEVGSFLGRSAAYMAVEIANSGKQIRFVCVDPFPGLLDGQHRVERCTPEAFRANMEKGGVSHLVELKVMTSVEAATHFADGECDFVFIDGAHDYENVRADITAWLPKVRYGGVLAGHDYGDGWPDVRSAVQNCLSWRNVKERADCVFWYENIVHDFGHWEHDYSDDESGEESDYLVHIPYVNRPDLLRAAIDSLSASERANAYIIDQSEEGFDATGLGIGCYRATRKVSFSQMQNFAIGVARFGSKKYSLFMHNDVSCAPGTVTKLAERARDTAEPWAALFTRDSIRGGVYDYLAAYNMAAIREVGCWDETFGWYVSDVDFYRRFKLAGKKLIDCPDIVVAHAGSQTIQSDAAIRNEAQADQQWALSHYRHKWGGPFDQERYTVPYDGRP